VSVSNFIESFETTYLKKELPSFAVGDTVKVHTKIIEGKKTRIQVFMGIVIAKKGSKLSETFTVYRNAYGCSMERVFLIHSPNVTKVEVLKRGKVRKAKLYYLKGESGKKAKVQEKLHIKKTKDVNNAESTIEKNEENQVETKEIEAIKEEVKEKPKAKKTAPKKDKKSEENKE
jgi:large subunit ribosomal protein L19